MEIETLQNVKKNDGYYVLRTKLDYILLNKDCQSIEIRFFDSEASKKLLMQDNIRRLKISYYCQNKAKYHKIMEFFGILLKKFEISDCSVIMPGYQDMTDNEVRVLQETLKISPYKFKKLELNLDNWGNENLNISKLSCQYIGKIFEEQRDLEVLSLQMIKWGLNNKGMDDDAIQFIVRGVEKCSNLVELNLNFQTWGCMKYSSLQSITNQSVQNISKMIQNLSKLKKLYLNLRSWGYSNNCINDSCLKHLGSSLSQLANLIKLTLNLYCWGYENKSITDSGLQMFQNIFKQKGKNFKKFNINMDGWSSDFKNEKSLNSVSDNSIEDLFKVMESQKQLEKFHVNLSSWGWKNQQITNRSLVAVGNFLQIRGNNLKQLDLNFKVWWSEDSLISKKGIENLCLGLRKCNQVTKLGLNLECMGFKNKYLNSDCIQIIGQVLEDYSELKDLELNLECWGVEDTESYGFIGNQEVYVLVNPIKKMKNLQKVSLNLNSWGYKNRNISDEGIQYICDSLEEISPSLISLDLQLRFWGYSNASITDKSFQKLNNTWKKLKNLQKFHLNIDSWGDRNPNISLKGCQQMLQQIRRIKYLKDFQFLHTLKDWSHNDEQSDLEHNSMQKLCEKNQNLIQETIKTRQNVLLSQGAILQQLSHLFRQELLQEVSNVMVE